MENDTFTDFGGVTEGKGETVDVEEGIDVKPNNGTLLNGKNERINILAQISRFECN